MRIQDMEFPDKCPDNCANREDISRYGQNSICFRCPVLICQGDPVLVAPEEYREDWAREWHRFFQDGTEPRLLLKLTGGSNE